MLVLRLCRLIACSCLGNITGLSVRTPLSQLQGINWMTETVFNPCGFYLHMTWRPCESLHPDPSYELRSLSYQKRRALPVSLVCLGTHLAVILCGVVFLTLEPRTRSGWISAPLLSAVYYHAAARRARKAPVRKLGCPFSALSHRRPGNRSG